MSSLKVHFPLLPLQEAVSKPGGITRENALEAAQQNLREVSGEADQTIETTIQTLEGIVAKNMRGLSPEQLREILSLADQIVTMAGTFNYMSLDRATRGLCDVADGQLQAGKGDAAPVAVHVRAMHLFSPLCAVPGPEESERILAELAKVASHYGYAPLG